MKRSIFIIVIFLLSFILIRIIITNILADNQKKQNSIQNVPVVKVANVVSDKVERRFSATARIKSKYRVDILARIDGYLVKSYFKEGDYVQAGQLLFEIEPQEYIYAVEKARAELNNAEAQYSYYEKQLSRYKALVKDGYVAKADYDNVLSQRDSYKSTVLRAQTFLNDAKRNLGYTHIKSPVNGRIGFIDVTVGNYVSRERGPLTTINSYEPMYVVFPLEKKEFLELARIDNSSTINRVVEFVFSNGETYRYKGVQDFLDNKVDETTGTITMRATFPNPNRELIQGDFGKVYIYSKLKDSIPVVPITAVMENQEGKYVYIIDQDGLPRISYIKILWQDDKKCYINSGVELGDRIVIEGIQKVIPGRKVKVIEG